ncbi:hypothetical protein FRC0141_01774 [Corynebacterium diphtheriae]|nr:hypothetical protein FRC0141_01774 [Corynebacterium diphtheriae]
MGITIRNNSGRGLCANSIQLLKLGHGSTIEANAAIGGGHWFGRASHNDLGRIDKLFCLIKAADMRWVYRACCLQRIGNTGTRREGIQTWSVHLPHD